MTPHEPRRFVVSEIGATLGRRREPWHSTVVVFGGHWSGSTRNGLTYSGAYSLKENRRYEQKLNLATARQPRAKQVENAGQKSGLVQYWVELRPFTRLELPRLTYASHEHPSWVGLEKLRERS